MFLVGSLSRFGSIAVCIVHIVACMGGCLGSHSKPEPIASINGPLKRSSLRCQGLKPGVSEDYWTTSTYEMDNSLLQSRGSISSISTSTLTTDPHCCNSGSVPSEFINHGLLLWNQTRQQWIGNKKSENRAQQLREPRISWNATYESLLGSNKRFAQPIPLGEMVDFLVDIWEQEGLYD
ncbi:hypothetical protein NMG60_11002669 [Bertholletia excelsa]